MNASFPLISSTIKKIDTDLHKCVSGIDILEAVAPLNYREQKAAFFESNYSANPEFTYSTPDLDLFAKKRALYNIHVDKLEDEDLVTLYTDVIESYVDKLDQFKSIGTPEFLYDSLRYYGEPSDKDIGNANFILHLPDDMDPRDTIMLDSKEVQRRMCDFAEAEGYEYQIKLNDSMIANALVSGTTVKINSAAVVPETEVNALMHHELGVHLVTTLNGRAQPLKILSLGSPVNTTTQEGLAILCEYLSGNLSLYRLKVLAMRVVAVQSMIHDKDFKRTFLLLKEEHGASDDQAFTITARVYRGGGFTKDYLYLQGFHQMLNAYSEADNFNNLLTGKASLAHLPLITRLIEKDYLIQPGFISPAIRDPQSIDLVQRFIARAIR
ncbi:MAG: flavohemoglobin expression-modulating QEGLA motif protein [Oleibacter sp.]|nr:flavohemoglobin expression-modulating QEGLA motif protein [Thalassolituus sp.]